MKIRFLQDRTLPNFTAVKAGQEIDLPDDKARAIVASGVAEAVTESKKTTKEVTEHV